MSISAEDVARRFWPKVDKRGPDDCWNWTGAKWNFGHGAFSLVTTRNSEKQTGAHRVSYQLAFGPIPEGMLVCHSCDNPSCVNPRHLFVGSNLDNMRDMVAKGRGARGEELPQTKLCAEDIRRILDIFRVGPNPGNSKLAAYFGVTQATISRIKLGKSWAHLAAVERVREGK